MVFNVVCIILLNKVVQTIQTACYYVILEIPMYWVDLNKHVICIVKQIFIFLNFELYRLVHTFSNFDTIEPPHENEGHEQVGHKPSCTSAEES